MAADGFDVLSGYLSVTLVIALGYLLRRTRVLDQAGESVINRVGLFVATPALYTGVLVRTTSDTILSHYALATLLAMVICLALAMPSIRLVSRRRPWRETALIATSTINPNSGNIGIPISIAVLGSAAPLAPVILIQVAVLSPVVMIMLELTSGRDDLRRAVRRAFVNPMLIAAIVGVTIALTNTTVPQPILASLDLVGGAAIPLLLLAFGASLVGARPVAVLTSQPLLVIVAVAAKSVILPLAAVGLGLWMGLESPELLALAIVASLPIAQNVYAIASAYDAAPDDVRSIVVFSTVVSLPLSLAVATFLGS